MAEFKLQNQLCVLSKGLLNKLFARFVMADGPLCDSAFRFPQTEASRNFQVALSELPCPEPMAPVPLFAPRCTWSVDTVISTAPGPGQNR